MQYTDAEWHLYWNAVARKHEERKEAMKNEQLEFDFVKDSTLPSGTERPESAGEDARNAPSGNADGYDGGWFGVVPPRHGKSTFETVESSTGTSGEPTMPVGPHTYQRGAECSYDPRNGGLGSDTVDTRVGRKPTPPEGYEIIPIDEYDAYRDDEEVLLFGFDDTWGARCYGAELDPESWYCRPVQNIESDQAQETVGYVTFSEQELSERANTTFIDIPDDDGFVSVPLAEFLSGDSRKSEFEVAAEQIGRLVTEKNRAYGNSFVDSAKILAILYPDGIPLHAYEDVGVIIRVCDKLKRIATDNDPFGEDPWEDIAGYGTIAHVRRTHKRRAATILARREDEHSGTDDCSD